MDKVAESAAAAVADVPDGATLLFGGFGVVQGWPTACSSRCATTARAT